MDTCIKHDDSIRIECIDNNVLVIRNPYDLHDPDVKRPYNAPPMDDETINRALDFMSKQFGINLTEAIKGVINPDQVVEKKPSLDS